MIAAQIKRITESLSKNITLVAVSKTKPNSVIEEAYSAGHRDFGENKVQELCQKAEALPRDIRWHMIGHLQRNKVKYIAPFVHLIHGVDSERLLVEINKQGEKNNRVIDVLIQVHIAEESSKFGFSYTEAETLFSNKVTYPNVRIIGLMGMATFTENEEQVKREFETLSTFYKLWKAQNSLTVLSMGMSNDYPLAVASGSNMIRVGSLIFGRRD
ncbi:MAG: YggS family pyridoxal phosphate-dependent enzyme [Gammaproteobacteria bacterium]|nr:YggS family pyridoxal phosphate-dependent enzyme [Gammaproteobacteria bacterium]